MPRSGYVAGLDQVIRSLIDRVGFGIIVGFPSTILAFDDLPGIESLRLVEVVTSLV